jgi:mRNA interferase RelE/StbE
MNYQIEILSKARRQIKKLPKNIQVLVRNEINLLTENPRPSGFKKLSNSDNLYRIRLREYRIVYQINDNILTILIVKVGHRREVYD